MVYTIFVGQQPLRKKCRKSQNLFTFENYSFQSDMAYHFIDNIYSNSLTPKEPDIELLEAAFERNIIVCLNNNSGKNFIASKLTQGTIHNACESDGTITVYISDSPAVVSNQAACFQRLTDMIVTELHNESEIQSHKVVRKKGVDQIFIVETKVAVLVLQNNLLNMSDINLLILHNCHCILKCISTPIKEVMKYYFESSKKPHILSLASSLFSSNLDLSQIKSSLNKMEDLLDCKAETASNVLSLLRYGTHPHEVMIEYSPHIPVIIDKIIEEEIKHAINFIRDHRYDPSEMYEGFTEELQNIPDPKHDPEEIFLELLNTLHTLGPWSTDRAALILLLQIEKLKVTTPYERHFLLLCMTSSVLVKIRAIFDDYFKDVSEKDKIYKYSSPKILRVIEILKKFIPEKIECNTEPFSNEANQSRDINSKLSDPGKTKLYEDTTELGFTKKCFNCDCDLMTEFLIKRLQSSLHKDMTYGNFVEMVKANNLLGKEKPLNNNINKPQFIESTQDSLEVIQSQKQTKCCNHDRCTCSRQAAEKTSGQYLHQQKEGRKFNNVVQSRNGYLPLGQGEVSKLMNYSSKSGSYKVNEMNTIENYLQYHEYLLLPKFKVDRHYYCDQFNVSTQLKEGQDDFIFRQMKSYGDADVQLCGLIFVEKKFTAKVLFHVLNDLKQADEDFSFLSVQFTVGKIVDGIKDPKGAENEHRKQELMLKKFRIRACNLLIGTSFLEEGIDLPKCNLVIRFDAPANYRSYINTKERARATDSLYCLLVDSCKQDSFVNELGKYQETEAVLLEKCMQLEPDEDEEREADKYTQLIQPFCPLLKQDCPHIDLSTAVTLVNRYCAKLPSDTFTRLTPMWKITNKHMFGRDMFICKIRLPINSPVKQEIEGCPMPTKVLARRFAAFQCCQALHLAGELDDTLQPISKESFWMREEEQLTSANSGEELEEMIPRNSLEPRPGTTKRRQYYYKRIADSLTDCLPIAGEASFLYDISMVLTCPLPEEQNTRGRKIHPPENSVQGFGILTRKSIPKIGPFPIFTRSGEVQVKLQLAQSTVVLSELQIDKIVAFIHYTFTSVLRLQKYLMMFDPNVSENSYFIVPTKRVGVETHTIEVDWDFLELIFEKKNQVPVLVPEEERKNFVFDAAKFEDAVVSPWYRNQDQPQYLYVAEIWNNLSPKSEFPGTEYDTFEEYYLKKYNITIQNSSQALLDVDHTSARLNFLTPRYVNRKGVALPTTSEEKKRAKRENLKQKQILIPELCDIHPFPATLWRKAVCLPCILHRINALLLADQVRRIVAAEIGIGSTDLDQDFNWQPLNFGWSLADVLKQTKALQKQETVEVNDETVFQSEKDKKSEADVVVNNKSSSNKQSNSIKEDNYEENEKNGAWIEIGTWSNDMANNKLENTDASEDLDDVNDLILPKNVTMIEEVDLNEINGWESKIKTELKDPVQCNSPTMGLPESNAGDASLTDCMTESSYSDDYLDMSSDTDTDSECPGLKIEFKDDNVAEAVESNQTATKFLKESNEVEEEQPWVYEESEEYSKYVNEFNVNLVKRKEDILNSDRYFRKEKAFEFTRPCTITRKYNQVPVLNSENESDLKTSQAFGNSDNCFPRLAEQISDNLRSLPLTDVILKSLNEEENLLKNQRHKTVDPEAEKVLPNLKSFNNAQDVSINFSFDEQPDLSGHPGPSPSLILQALTMSNANDGINLERLETIGDSFLKYAITTYLYCVYENVHEGKLSHLRSKQVSNFNLYRLGRRKVLGESMIATKFEPHDNWLPPCYYVPRELERALIEAGVPASHWNRADLPSLRNLTKEEICQLVKEKGEQLGIVSSEKGFPSAAAATTVPCLNLENMPCFIPYNLMTQHSIPDKSIADCVEALIGAYLVACGPRGALLFMSWLGIKVLPKEEKFFKSENDPDIRKGVGCSLPTKVTTNDGEEVWSQVCFGELQSPKQPLIRHVENPEGELERLLRGFDVFEDNLQYHFRDRSYLLQALTHASYFPNRLTDCYQRLEFLGDAVLDYLITRHLYEDPRHHSPGALTDLRSALVNNTIFASLAVRHNFHKYFRHLCPSLNEVVDRFVRFQQENGHAITEEFYLIEEEECEEAEDVEVPKALGDVFESVAGAIFLDSGMSLDAVWKVYYRIMKNEIELFSTNVPKSPIRELFELEPETAQFGKPEKLADGRRVRVSVEVFGKGLFNGIGRNYRIAKCTAAKCALKQLKRKGLIEKRK